jgi:Na+-driven multidrug efflux pump
MDEAATLEDLQSDPEPPDAPVCADAPLEVGPNIDNVLQEQEEEEHLRLGGMTPLKTILFMTIGPLLSEVCQSVYGLMDSFWIGRTIGEDGLTVMSLVSVVDFVSISFSMYFGVATSSRLSYLFGRGKKDITAQVLVDLLRYCLIFGAVMPAVILPIAKPLMRFYGGDEDHVSMCFDFLLVASTCLFVDFVFLTLCGALQSMGHTILFGGAQVCFAVINMAVWDPIMLVAFKTPMWGVSLATVLSQLVPTLFIGFRLFRGHFIIQPTFAMFLKPFNKHSLKALKVAIGQLIANLMTTIPSLLIMKLLAMAGEEYGDYEASMSSWNVFQRVYVVGTSVCLALNQGFLPAGSFAVGKGDGERLKKLAFNGLVIGLSWALALCAVVEGAATPIARLFGNDETYVKICVQMFRYGFATIWANMPEVGLTALLQALKMVKLSVWASVLMFIVPVPVFSVVCYVSDSDAPAKLLLSYVARDAWALLFLAGIVVWKLRWLFQSGSNEALAAKLKELGEGLVPGDVGGSDTAKDVPGDPEKVVTA